jgi:hypothetical protein
MIKRYMPMLCLLLTVFLSCKKTDLTSTNQLTANGNSNVPKRTITITPAVTDTIPPANAVNVKLYGALGDGVHDDTKALQKCIDAEKSIVFTQGTYIISNTLNLHPGVKIYGSNGAAIKPAANMSGTLLSNGRYIYINNADSCLVSNMQFQQSTGTYNLGIWSNACIYVLNSKASIIQFNSFNFSLPYGSNGIEAVWISGNGTLNSIIKGNKSTSAGIEYAESGASGTTADGNYIQNACADALSAHGNTSQYCLNNVIKNNTIVNAGFMGIEDWGNVDGSIIQNNVITGTGKDPLITEGMGISAVGANTRVINNQISDAQLYYIESMGSNNCYIDSNIINDTKGLAVGIIVNFTAPADQSARASYNGSNVVNNTINNCQTSIQIYGNYTTAVTLSSNTIVNPQSIGVDLDSDSPVYTVAFSNNTFIINQPNKQRRKAFQSFTRLPHDGLSNQSLAVSNNSLTYTSTANGGTGSELGFDIGTDYTVINNNQIAGNNIKAGGAAVSAITGDGDLAVMLTIVNNVVTGAIVNLSAFTIKTKSGNNF